MFDIYKLKYIGSVPFIEGYIYKNYTVTVSKESGYLLISLCPHGATLLGQDEICGILSYLGFNPAAPYEHKVVQHIGDPSLGDTNYYLQKV